MMTDNEINRLVAEKVMGLPSALTEVFGEEMDYCNSWSAMGKVIEKMGDEGYGLDLKTWTGGNVAYFVKQLTPFIRDEISAEAESAPKAVALAALKAKEK